VSVDSPSQSGLGSPAGNPGDEPLLQVEHVSKRFPQILANDDISFSVARGEIHCLLGENGAGKSTLAEVLYGVQRPDSGTILFRGLPVTLSSPRDAIQLGIGMVHQHFVLVPPFTVLENVIIGTQHQGLRLDRRQAAERLGGLCTNYGVNLDLDAQIWHLCVGEQQWVEILKAVYVGVELLILDEPTASLTPQEVDKLFAIMRKMRDDGLSMLFITHKLNEVLEVSDRVTVLRKGKLVHSVATRDTSQRELARMMVGREVDLNSVREPRTPGLPVLEVDGLRVRDDRNLEALRGVSFTLRQGEILGVAGVSGNGQRELFDALTGARKPFAGLVRLAGREITHSTAAQIADLGVASVPEDRVHQGLVMEFRVDENLILGKQRLSPFANGAFLNQRGIAAFAEDMIREYEIATPSGGQVTRVLSGGNLQKVILARELAREPQCLIVSQPTRGLDVGAMEYVRRRLVAERDRGAGVLLISEDLDELFSLATRIAVMFRGQIVGMLDAETASREQVGLLMAGCESTV